MQIENPVFLFREADKQLFCRERGGSFGKLTPEVIDQEMRFGKSPTQLHIHGITQEGLEHFARRYGASCEVLYLDDCRGLTDLSPLETLPKLAAVCLERCQRVEALWQLSKNRRLRILSVRGCKKLTYNPCGLSASETLEEVRFWGEDSEYKYRMQSMAFLSGMSSLERLDLNNITLEDHFMSVLQTLPNLETFHFDANMLTTEEIAAICVRFPHIRGQSLGAYSMEDARACGDVRICGYRKPTLTLPEQEDKLRMYVEQFDRIKERILKQNLPEQ